MITAVLLVLDRSGCQAVEYNWRPTSKCDPLSSSLFDGGLLTQQRMNMLRRCECKKLLIKKITSTWVQSFIPFFFLSPPGMSLKPTAGPQPWPNFSCFMPYLLLEQQGGIRWCVSPVAVPTIYEFYSERWWQLTFQFLNIWACFNSHMTQVKHSGIQELLNLFKVKRSKWGNPHILLRTE